MDEWTCGPFTIRQSGPRFYVYHDGSLRIAALGDELACLCDVIAQAEVARLQQAVPRDRPLLEDPETGEWRTNEQT